MPFQRSAGPSVLTRAPGYHIVTGYDTIANGTPLPHIEGGTHNSSSSNSSSRRRNARATPTPPPAEPSPVADLSPGPLQRWSQRSVAAAKAATAPPPPAPPPAVAATAPPPAPLQPPLQAAVSQSGVTLQQLASALPPPKPPLPAIASPGGVTLQQLASALPPPPAFATSMTAPPPPSPPLPDPTPVPLKPRKGRWRRRRKKRGSICPVARGLSEESWRVLVTEEGQVRNMYILLGVIQSGGIDRELRPQVWPLLLGCISPEDSIVAQQMKAANAETTFERLVRLAATGQQAADYYATRGAIEPWEATQRRVMVDSVRTGRDGPLFQGEHRTRTVARLERVLLAYALSDPEVGYCQGMADLAAPFLHLYPTDAQVFWAFRGLMRQLRGNFLEGMASMQSQMDQLKQLVALIDPALYKHMQKIGAEGFDLSFQMLLMCFRRELCWEDTFIFWEGLWAAEMVAQAPLRVHVAAGLFTSHRRQLLKFSSLEDLVLWVNGGIPVPGNVLDLVSDAYQLWTYLQQEPSSNMCGCVRFGGPGGP